MLPSQRSAESGEMSESAMVLTSMSVTRLHFALLSVVPVTRATLEIRDACNKSVEQKQAIKYSSRYHDSSFRPYLITLIRTYSYSFSQFRGDNAVVLLSIRFDQFARERGAK